MAAVRVIKDDLRPLTLVRHNGRRLTRAKPR
jgi:hypothetical protein